jgi:hypothetical protein
MVEVTSSNLVVPTTFLPKSWYFEPLIAVLFFKQTYN